MTKLHQTLYIGIIRLQMQNMYMYIYCRFDQELPY